MLASASGLIGFAPSHPFLDRFPIEAPRFSDLSPRYSTLSCQIVDGSPRSPQQLGHLVHCEQRTHRIA